MKKTILVTVIIASSIMSFSQNMNNLQIDKLLNESDKIDVIKSQLGYWIVSFYGKELNVITDESHNRMRIISPITEEKNVKQKQYKEILQAQFHKALDVKYALFNGYIWSAFVHPLKELSDNQFNDALWQVFMANANFGTSYKSAELQFGSGDEKGKR